MKFAELIFKKVETIFVGTVLRQKILIGEILIKTLPDTSIPENTEEMRKLWIGCRIPGTLLIGEKRKYQPYADKQPALKNCFEVTYKNAIEALENLHGDRALDCMLFWKNHYKWSDEEYQAWVGEMRILVRHTLLFNRECFYFIPREDKLTKMQQILWRILKYLGQADTRAFQGITV